MVVTANRITEDMLCELEQAGKRFEVIDGELVEAEVTGENHGRLEFKLLLAIGNHVMPNHLGMLYPGDTDFVLDGEPGNIRLQYQCDVGFLTTEHMVSTTGYIYRAPNLAVEIISPSQTYIEIRSKVKNYLKYGTQQVWIVLPESKEIEVHTLTAAPKTYTVGDTLPGGDLLPGLLWDVKSVFEE